MRHRLIVTVLLGVIGTAALAGVGLAQGQFTYVAIDMIRPAPGAGALAREAPQLIGQSPLILVKGAVGGWYVRAMTLEEGTGIRLGDVADIAVPPEPCYPPNPIGFLHSEFFLPGRVIVVGDDGSLVQIPISILPDGTPEGGPPMCHPPEPGFADLGPASAIAELPGSAFGDGRPRLFVGTQNGMIAMYLIPIIGGGPTLEGVIDLLAGQPIQALGPIPQTRATVLGAAVGREIVGIINPETIPAVKFGIINPDVFPVADFVAEAGFGPAAGSVFIAFGDGVHGRIPRAQVPSDASGSSTMVLFPPNPVIPILTSPPVDLALGSLLMLTADGQGVYYDPFFDMLTGTSLCIADVNDPEGAVCVECPVTLTGDVNENYSLTSADIIFLVGFIFKSGAPPDPCEMAGDVNCDGKVTSADVIYLVNHIFKGGSPPCDVCSIWLDPWICLF